MEYNKVNLTFKAKLKKEWKLLEDRIIFGNREILLSEIQAVDVSFRSNAITNGVIKIFVGEEEIHLVYPNKSKTDGDIAIEYIQKNYGNVKGRAIKKSLDEIQDEIDKLPVKDKRGGKKETLELANILLSDEEIKATTCSRIEGNIWFVVCTNKRILMLHKGMIKGIDLIEIPFARINGISYSKGIAFGDISIENADRKVVLKDVSSGTINFFVERANKEIEIYRQGGKNPDKNINTISTADELLKFKQLLDMGVITQEEFDIKKKELLGL